MTSSVRVAGVKFHWDAVQRAFPGGCGQCKQAQVVPDPDNPYHCDPQSVALKVIVNDEFIGFIPQTLCRWWAQHTDEIQILSATRFGEHITLMIESPEFAPN